MIKQLHCLISENIHKEMKKEASKNKTSITKLILKLWSEHKLSTSKK